MLLAALATTGLNEEEVRLILTERGLQGEELETAMATISHTAAEVGATTATGALTGATASLGLAFKGLWTTLMANPIILVVAGLATVATILYKVKQANDEAKQAEKERHEQEIQTAKDSVEKHNEELKSLQDVVAEYGKYKNVAHLTSQEKERLMEIQQSLIDKYGSEAESIDLINGKYDEQIAKLQQLTREQAKQNTSNLQVLLDEAEHNANDNISPEYTQSKVKAYQNKEEISDDNYRRLVEMANNISQLKLDVDYHTLSVQGDVVERWADVTYGLYKGTSETMAKQAKAALDELDKMRLRVDDETQELVQSQGFKDLYSWLNSQYEHYSKEASELAEAYDNMAENLVQTFETNINGNNYNMYNLNSSVFGQWKDELLNKTVDPDMKKAIEKYLGNVYADWVEIADTQAEDKLNKIKNTFADGLITRMAKANSDPKKAQSDIDAFVNWIDSLPDEQKTILLNIDFDNSEIDFSQFGIADWKEYLDNNFEHTLYDKLSEDFFESVDTYKDKVTSLKSALEDFQKGEFEPDDFVKLTKDFPELIGHTDDLDVAIQKLLNDMNSDMVSEFNSQFGNLDTEEDKQKLQDFMDTVLELGQVVGSTEFSIDIEAETQGMEDFYTAVKESVSATGLSAKSIENLKERYKNLFTDNPDKRQQLMNQLFERSEHGIHLNAAALRELESEYENTQKAMFKDELVVLTDKYNDLTEKINQCSDTSQKAQLYAKRQEILDQINEVADLATQYEGLTSAFNKWLEAQDTPDEDDMFQKLSSGLEDIKTLFEEGRVGVDDFREAVQMMTDTDLSTASIEELLAMYDSGIGTMERFFTGNGEGLQAFIDMLVKVSTQAGETWATIDEFGNYNFDFGVGDDSKIVEAINNMTDLQMSTEEVQILLRALSAYGFDINLDSIFSKFDLLKTDFESLEELVEAANQKLIEVGATEFKFNINTESAKDLNEQVGEIYQTIQDMYATNEKDQLNVKYSEEDFKAAQEILTALVAQKESLNDACVLKIDTTTADDDIHTVIGKLQNFQTAYSIVDSLVAVGADTTEAQAEVEYWRGEILKEETTMLASLKLDNKSVDTMYASINEITPEMLVKAGLDESEVEQFINKDKNSDATVKYNVDDSEVDKWINQNHDTNAKVIFHNSANEVYTFLNNLHDQHRYVYYHNVNSDANGTANYRGTAHAKGTAFRRGDWGTKDSGTALVGELGTETLVRDGTYQTIGDNGAEFIRYRKGDIIFNHKQTEELFKNGRVTSSGGRGKVYADGTAFSSGSGRLRGKGTVKTNPSDSSSGGSSNGGNSNSSSEQEITYDKIDWVEIALDRISRAVDKLKRKATSVYNSFSTRNKNLSKEIGKVRNEIEKNLAGADRYYKEAWNVGLDESIAKKVRDGTINIQEYDSDTADKIEEYQKWYEKMLECQEAAEELQETLKGLYKERFDNAVANWTNRLEIYEHTIDRAVSRIDQRTTKASKYVNPDNTTSAYKNNIKDYKKIVNDEKKELKQLEKERNELNSLMWDAVYNGNITVGSEAYYEMLQQIHDIENDIDNLNKEIIDNTNEIAAQYESIFNSITNKYETALSYAEKVSQKYTAQMELAEAKGLSASTYYYTQLRSIEQRNLKKLQDERSNLQIALNQAVSSGTIKTGSEAWYEMKSAIQEVDNKIIETTKDIVEYNNQIRQIKWDRFDLLQDKIKNVENETSFLLSLLDDDKFFDEKGQLIAQGKSALGLYAIDYDLLMNQANDYAEEIKKIQSEIAKDPSNIDLIKRREELLKNQQESIKAAEQEKKAIVNLVEKGIKLELSSLKDLIDTYTDSLDSAKDLYEYQKKIKSQTSDISSLQKQLAAYAGDTSEENKARVQKITVDLAEAQEQLAESEYDQFVTDSKKLLDNLYSEYETVLNERLDNVDGLIRDMIDTVNVNSRQIAQTIESVSTKVGYTLTNEYKDILGGNKPIANYYSSKFGTSTTNVNKVVNSIESKLSSMVKDKTASITKFKTGGLADFTGLAQLDGTPDRPELVLNPQDTENYMKLTEVLRQKANNPLTYGDSDYGAYVSRVGHNIGGSEAIKEMLDKFSKFEGAEINVTQNYDLGGIQIDHVQDYNDFVTQLQQDRKFEKMINAMTIDRLAGGSSLAKTKYKWN